MVETRPHWKRLARGLLLSLLGVLFLAVAVLVFGYTHAHRRTSQDSAAIERDARRVMKFEIQGGAQGVVQYPVFGVDVFVLQARTSPPEGTLVLALFPVFSGNKVAEKRIRRRVEERVARRMVVAGERTIRRSICLTEVSVRIRQGQTRARYRGLAARTAVTSYDALIRHQGRLRFVMAIGAGPRAASVAEQIFASLACPQ